MQIALIIIPAIAIPRPLCDGCLKLFTRPTIEKIRPNTHKTSVKLQTNPATAIPFEAEVTCEGTIGRGFCCLPQPSQN